jgi:thiol-disulfide isomerase/thioredoxin
MTYDARRAPARRTVAALAAAVLVAAVALTGCSTSQASGGASGYIEGEGTVTVVPAAGRSQPRSFAGTTLDGATFDVASTRGHVTVVNVWASWCPPCRAEAPGLEQAHQALQGKGVRFVGIDTRDEAPQARAYVKRFGITFPNISDDGGAVLLAFRDTLPPTAIPSTLVLDRKGRIAVRVLGGVTDDRLRQVVEQVMAEPS